MNVQPELPQARHAGPVRVCLIGLHAAGLALGRALRRLGHEPIGLYQDLDEPGRASNCFTQILPFSGQLAQLEELASLGGGDAKPLVVIVTSDKAVEWLCRQRIAADSPLRVCRPSAEIFQEWFLKTTHGGQGRGLEELLQAPRSALLADWRGFAEKTGAPWIIKPASASVGAQYHVAKVQFIDNRAELEGAAERYGEIGEQILVQEWIPGEDSQHGFVGGVCRGGWAHPCGPDRAQGAPVPGRDGGVHLFAA